MNKSVTVGALVGAAVAVAVALVAERGFSRSATPEAEMPALHGEADVAAGNACENSPVPAKPWPPDRGA
jgi:hypothetical protein